ncbi:hypothetical protein C8F01DRAFT_194722 [Mycena amicta]|nr:hypothetical protein C8F01DRAFT_194722 [Mycena amicta]
MCLPDAQTLRTIASQFADGELMPNLSSFACHEPLDSDDTGFPAYMSLFVTPKLTELSLALTALTSMDLFLPLLSLVIPFEQLERLSLLLSVVSTDDGPIPPDESSIRQIYASIIPRLHQIRYLGCYNLGSGALLARDHDTEKAASQMQIRPITTLDALRAFARHCRKLEFLSMSIDATVAPAFDNFVLEHPSQLGQLEVHHSPITSARVSDIARFIFSLFPNIKAIQGQEDLPAWWSRPREETMEQTEPIGKRCGT